MESSLITIAAWISILFMVFSLWRATNIRVSSGLDKETYKLLAFWALAPPLWFFVEFEFLHPCIDAFELARVKQAQDLARNIWVAFVVVLAAIMGVKWPPDPPKS